jgi:hypothetical protein
MERFTNNLWLLYERARHELFPAPGLLETDLWVRLGVMPSFQSWFSISILREPNGGLTLLRREWDCVYDFERFYLKIYNLDRLRITQTYRRLGYTESRKLMGIISRIELTPLPDSMKEAGFVKDGVTYKLELKGLGKEYEWKLFNERTKAIEPLTDYLLTGDG